MTTSRLLTLAAALLETTGGRLCAGTDVGEDEKRSGESEEAGGGHGEWNQGSGRMRTLLK